MSSDTPPLHLVSWNIENLARHLGGAPAHGSLPGITEAFGEPDILCLQELRLRPRDAELVDQAERALPGYVFFHSLADDPENAAYRGGRAYGVGTYVRAALEPVPIPRQSWDREGRMVGIVLVSMRLTVINVYAVNGTAKRHWDHDVGAFRGDRHKYKRRFHEHVAETVRSVVAATDFGVLLLGDWNVSQTRIDTTPRLRTEEPHATSRAHFADIVVRGLDVVDVFRALHPEKRRYTWFSRRPPPGRLDAARVDFALLSRARLPDVLTATIDDASAGCFGSDHVPISVTMSRP